MKNDYLWDGSGEPDPEIQHLEEVLGRLRGEAVAWRPPSGGLSAGPAEAGLHAIARWVPLLATAAIVALAVGFTWRATRTLAPAAAFDVARIDGRPRIGGRTVDANGRLAVGQTLTTDGSSRARIEVGAIGEVTVDRDSRVRLVTTRPDRHQFALDRGTLHARITAPPGQFIVDTPSATATDLGCAYTLHVDDEGGGRLMVETGWVAFEYDGRESFVPQGASCAMDPRGGPGTPSFDDATKAFHEGLDAFDFGAGPARADGLRRVLKEAHRRDALTLWHLLPRVDAADRGAVFDALAARFAPPDGVTREAVLRLDRTALDRWWETFELGDVSFWRSWKRPLPAEVR
jgi:hypothetical protein